MRILVILSLFVLATAWPAISSAQPIVVPPGSSLSLGAGTQSTAGYDVTVNGTLYVMSGTLIANNLIIGPSGSLIVTNGLVQVSGDWSNNGQFIPGTGTVEITDGVGSTGTVNISGQNRFHNLTIASSTGLTVTFPAGTQTLISGEFSSTGTPPNPVTISSSDSSIAANILARGGRNFADTVISSISFQAQEITAIPASSPISLAAIALALLTLTFHWTRNRNSFVRNT